MGMFGIAEVVSSINQVREGEVREDINMRTMTPTREDVRQSIMPMLRGTAVGDRSLITPPPLPRASDLA